MQQIQVGKEKTRFKMDRNALTEQRRQTVIGLLKGMNIKRALKAALIRMMYTNACSNFVTFMKKA